MNIKKQDLYDYIEKVSKESADRLREKQKMLWNEMVVPVAKKHLEAHFDHEIGAGYEEAINLLKPILTNFRDAFPTTLRESWNTRELISNVSSAPESLKSRMIASELSRIYELAQSDNPIEKYYEHTLSQEALKDIKEYCSQFYKAASIIFVDIEAIRRLKAEANRVVKGLPSGKKAYEQLLEMGFPLEDFKPSKSSTALTIQKFSHPVCILKGNCEESEEVSF